MAGAGSRAASSSGWENCSSCSDGVSSFDAEHSSSTEVGAKYSLFGGALTGPSAFFCKHPPRQMTDDEAYEAVEGFIADSPVAASAS